ncbi:MAG TPA: RDD family protein [Thermoleophilaceae bacterium]|nr:RDD family protein [Thermoleophilaceae bacterium]
MNAISQFPARASGPSLDNRRVAAGAVDLAVVGAAGALLSVAAGGSFTPLLGAVTVAWGLFYYFVCESSTGQTLGKRLFGLRVERAGGGAADDRAIGLRTVLRVVDGIGLYLVGLVAMLASGERRQRLGDRVAGTVVVAAGSAPAASSAPASAAEAAPVAEAPAEPEPEPVGELPPLEEEKPHSLFGLGSGDASGEEAAEEDGPRVEIVSERAEGSEEPVDAEPAAEEPAVEAPKAEEPQAEEPQAEEPQADAEQADAAEPAEAGSKLPRVSSPAIEDLAKDVAATAGSKPAPTGEEPSAADEDPEPEADEPVEVKPIETVSPIELVMGDGEDEHEDEPEESEKPSPQRARTRGGAA